MLRRAALTPATMNASCIIVRQAQSGDVNAPNNHIMLLMSTHWATDKIEEACSHSGAQSMAATLGTHAHAIGTHAHAIG